MSSDESAGGDNVLDGRYRLLRRLGSGGMASVWAAGDERLGREVAIKILSDVLADDEAYRRRFEREARVAAGLTHAGLVPIYDFGTASGRPYLVMELVSGQTLAERIAAGNADELDLVELARELLDALAHIHAAGVVHRDIKPANVLVGEDGRVRLTDFGIAQPQDATSLTQTGQLIGTLAYMAPELRRGEPATPRSDLYALGVVLRECGAEQHHALAPLVGRLTATDPTDRPASATEALATLSDRIAGPTTEATEPLPASATTVPLGPAARGATVTLKPRRRLTAAPLLAALAATTAIALAVVINSDDGDEAPSPGSNQPVQGSEPRGTSGERDAETDRTPPATDDSCSAIETEKKALEEEKKAAEESAGDDQEAKEAIKQQFEADKKALEEREKTCRQ